MKVVEEGGLGIRSLVGAVGGPEDRPRLSGMHYRHRMTSPRLR